MRERSHPHRASTSYMRVFDFQTGRACIILRKRAKSSFLFIVNPLFSERLSAMQHLAMKKSVVKQDECEMIRTESGVRVLS